MWLINFIPDWIYHAFVSLGLVGLVVSSVLSYIPAINQYRHPITLVSGLVFAIGLFMEGLIFGLSDMKEQVAAMEEKVKVAEHQAAIINEKVVIKYKTNVVKVKEVTNDILQQVETHIDKSIDTNYPVPNAFVVLHDSASQNQIPPSAGGAYEGTSDVKTSEVARTVTENYGTCYEIREQVKGWQNWYTEQKTIFDNSFK